MAPTETNGSVSIPGVGRLSFAGMAREAGYSRAYEFDNLEDRDRGLEQILHDEGPVLVDLKVEPGERYPEDFRRLYSVKLRDAFRQALSKR